MTNREFLYDVEMTSHTATTESFILRQLMPSDAANYRDLRLEGLKSNPEGFGASFDDEASKPFRWFEEGLEANIVFGGYTGDGAAAGKISITRVMVEHRRVYVIDGKPLLCHTATA